MTIYQRSLVSRFTRFKIDTFDADSDDAVDEVMEDSRPSTMKQGGSFKAGHIILGSVQKPVSFEEVSAAHSNDPAFSHFYRKFSQFLRTQDIDNFEYADFDGKKLKKVRFHGNLSTI